MNKYKVLFIPTAEKRNIESLRLGCEFWGEERAASWLRGLYRATFDRLSEFPKSCAVAPESGSLRREVRQYVYGRYRILFEIRDRDVVVLRLTGPFNARGDK